MLACREAALAQSVPEIVNSDHTHASVGTRTNLQTELDVALSHPRERGYPSKGESGSGSGNITPTRAWVPGHFTSERFTRRFLEAGVKISMDGQGRYLDNIFTERLWRSVKYEEVYLSEYGTPREAREGLRRYFRFYNEVRPHQALGYATPAEIHAMSPKEGRKVS